MSSWVEGWGPGSSNCSRSYCGVFHCCCAHSFFRSLVLLLLAVRSREGTVALSLVVTLSNSTLALDFDHNRLPHRFVCISIGLATESVLLDKWLADLDLSLPLDNSSYTLLLRWKLWRTLKSIWRSIDSHTKVLALLALYLVGYLAAWDFSTIISEC